MSKVKENNDKKIKKPIYCNIFLRIVMVLCVLCIGASIGYKFYCEKSIDKLILEDYNVVKSDLSSQRNISYTSKNSINTSHDDIDGILGDNIYIDGARIYQNPDGSIQIGGDPIEGAKIMQ